DAGFAIALRSIERACELLLVREVLRLELHGLLERGERVGGHVVLEVHVAERGQRTRARRDGGEDAFPRLYGERLISVLEIAIAEIDEVAGIVRADLREAREHLERAIALA